MIWLADAKKKVGTPGLNQTDEVGTAAGFSVYEISRIWINLPHQIDNRREVTYFSATINYSQTNQKLFLRFSLQQKLPEKRRGKWQMRVNGESNLSE
jgi:hypothetical protein